MKRSASTLKMWSFRSGRIVLACLLTLMSIPFMGAGKVVHATSPTWAAVGQTVQPLNVKTLLKANGTLYAGTWNGSDDVFSNSNGTWTRMIGSPGNVRTLLVEADGTLYAGAWGDGNNVSMYTASDGWTQMSGSPGNVYSLIDVNGTIYAGASNGPSSKDVWTYTANDGWMQMIGSPSDVQALIDVNGTLYAGTLSSGIWAYSNGAWTQMGGLPQNVISLVDVNGTLFAGTFGGAHSVWMYDNNNSAWTLLTNSPRYARTLFNVNGTLYVGTDYSYNDVWTCSYDGSNNTWTWTRTSDPVSKVYALLDDNGTLYAGTQTGSNDVWMNSNGTWTQMGALPGSTNTLLSANGTLYAGTDNDTNAVWAYTASGGWTRMSGSPGYVYALIDINGKLYAGTNNDDDDNDVWTYDTTAGTPAWTQIPNSPSNVNALLNVDGTLYAGTNNGDNDIWTYDPAATTPEWTQLAISNMTGPRYVNALVEVNGTLYVGTNYDGSNEVWTYDTAAAIPAWTKMTNAPGSVYSMLNVNGTLYAGTFNGDNDVWTYDTNADSEWTQISGAPSGVNALIDVNGTLYAGTDSGYGNNDVWSYSNGTWEQVSGSPSQLHVLLGINGNLYAGGVNGVVQLTAPGAPANLQSGSTTSASTTLSWNDVSGATGYYLYKNGGNTAIATVTGTTYTVSGLTPNTSYTFKVSAFNVAGESAQSGAIPVQTLSTDATLTSTIGTVSLADSENGTITDIPYGTSLDELKAAITKAENATYKVYDEDGRTEATTLATGKKVIVTAQDGTTKVTYTLTVIPAYSVTYNSNGASGNAPTDSGSYSQGDTVTVYGNTGNLVKTGYTFDGWNTAAGGSGTSYAAGSTFTMNTSGVTLYAMWEINTYTVSFNSNSGSPVSSQPVNYNLTATKPTDPTRSGYTFGGWYSDSGLASQFDFTASVTADTTLYAKWTINTYTVTFNSNGGSAVSSQQRNDNSTATKPTDPTRSGYTFGGWYSDSELASQFDFTASVTADTTLYAKWTINTYTVTFNSNGGSAVSSQQRDDNSTVTKPTDPTRSGYTFGGWYSDSGLTVLFNFTAPITADATLYAKWTANNTANPGGSSSNGGTPSVTPSNNPVISTDGTLTLPIGKSGEVSLGDDVKIIIPADASGKDLKVTIEKVADTQKLLTSKDTLVSPVFEILKNFSENFNKEIILTFTFDPKGLKGKQKPSVFFYDEIKKVWVEVGGEVKGNTITIKVNHFTKYAVLAAGQGEDSATVTEQPINFSDISGHWAEASIKQAVSFGIVSGYPDGIFNPNRTVTRAEFAVMLMNALKPQRDGAELTFTDKGKIGTWAQKSVAQAVQAGIITGYEDSTFRPDAEITRSEMAVMIAKALEQSVEATTASGFADDKDIPDWAKGAVGAMKKLRIIEGKGANAFAPGDKATRAESVTVMLKMLAQKEK